MSKGTNHRHTTHIQRDERYNETSWKKFLLNRSQTYCSGIKKAMIMLSKSAYTTKGAVHGHLREEMYRYTKTEFGKLVISIENPVFQNA